MTAFGIIRVFETTLETRVIAIGIDEKTHQM